MQVGWYRKRAERQWESEYSQFAAHVVGLIEQYATRVEFSTRIWWYWLQEIVWPLLATSLYSSLYMNIIFHIHTWILDTRVTTEQNTCACYVWIYTITYMYNTWNRYFIYRWPHTWTRWRLMASCGTHRRLLMCFGQG